MEGNFTGLYATFRPISTWPGELTRRRIRSPFKARWSDTQDLLRYEVARISKTGERPIIEMAITESQIRQDGYPYAQARPEHPGVIVNVESRFGPLRYPCDTFRGWQCNFRAIGLGLEALRKLERYGIAGHGEQYVGWKALPPAGGSAVTLSTDEAVEIVLRTASLDLAGWRESVLTDHADYRLAYKRAVRFAHPDGGGSEAAFQRLQEAARTLEAHHGRE